MMDSGNTSLTLLRGLGDPNNSAAWERFDAIYRPMLVKFGLHLGLDPTDAEEAAQRTTVAFCRAFQEGKYDQNKGRFRNWLLGIARHEISDLRAERARQPMTPAQRSSINDALALLSDSESLSSIWEREWRDHILSLCLQRAKRSFTQRDIRVFEMLTGERMSADQVAQQMGMKPAAVYQVKHRILKFMGEVKAELENIT